MLKKLRNKKTAKKIWIALAVLILPAFILWGSGSLIRNSGQQGYAGNILGRKIPFSEYKDAIDASRNQAIFQFGEDISEIQKNLNLEAMAWERLLLLAEAKKRKIKASDKEVVNLIESYPFFQKKGRFDNSLYLQMLEYVFHTQARVFEEQARENLMISRLFMQATGNVSLSAEEIKEAYRKNNEQISLYYITSQYADFTKDINPSEEEIKEYFTKNSLKFKQPLSFNLEYIPITTAGENEESIKDKIKDLSGRLNKNTDFAKVAKDFNSNVKETGLFGQTDPIPGIGWSPEILKLISKAAIGEFLPLIYMDKNYYILRLKEKKESYIPDFTTVKDKAKEMFIKGGSEEIARQKIEGCFKKLKERLKADPKSIDFDAAARECGLKSASTGLFNYGSYIEGIGASDNFWMLAKELKEEEFSEVAYMPSGFYIVKLKSRVPIDENKFAAEKDEFAQRLLSQKKSEYFAIFIKEIKKNARLF